MMLSNHETELQAFTRLRTVLIEADMFILPGQYSFYEVDVAEFPLYHINKALVFVRDKEVWSFLAPANSTSSEKFLLFSFHFIPGLDNSGFVGWLASHLKATTGTGVMVICGQNSKRGGIFDYWGVPDSAAKEVLAQIEQLRNKNFTVNLQETTILR